MMVASRRRNPNQLRRNHEALILQRYLDLVIISRPLAIIDAALTVLSLAFLINVAYDIVSLLLLVLVKLSSVKKNFRKHLCSFRKAFQKIGWLLNFLMSLLLLVLVKLSSVQKNFRKHLNRMGDSDFGWTRLDKEDDTHVTTKEKSRYRYDGMLDIETMTNPKDRTVAPLLKHPKETKEIVKGVDFVITQFRLMC
ncbi:hypothetical protein F2Q70_00009294 [Brassica cretica]|uniref:Uncharacterized protein n=1 Tax=Brassica cretica TaxID=69181 RepID=A0A8S9LQL2_BRACR|nr:hypothetical protein F2Q70_00009294 [Brassica cretica]